MDKTFYSISEVAKILGISRVAVLKKVKNGQIPAQRIGRIFAIPKETISEILGQTLSAQSKQEIDKAVGKAIKDYKETFKMLGET